MRLERGAERRIGFFRLGSGGAGRKNAGSIGDTTIDSCPSLAYSQFMVFIESPIFTRLVQELLTDDSYARLQQFLEANPDAGDVIQGMG